ncbi:unnamed protein product, partial [Sphagnum balticum]
MAKEESRDDFVPDLSSEEQKDLYQSLARAECTARRIDLDILKSAEEVPVDLFRSGNGSQSNLVRAKTNDKITSEARDQTKNS